MGCRVRVVRAFNPLVGVFGVLRFRGVRCKVFSGFRAGVVALLLWPLVGEYIYDLVEWKADVCRDNWSGFRRVFVPLVDVVERLVVRFSRLVFNAGRSFVHPCLRGFAGKVVFAENGYSDELFDPGRYDRRSVRERYGVDFPLVLYVGKLTPMYAKYLVPVIEAMEAVRGRFPDAEFWIFGDGPCRGFLERYSGRWGVRVKGYLPFERVPEVVAMADVGVNAYRTESLKLREWLAMGLPVVAPLGVRFPGVVNCEWRKEEIARSIVRIIEEGVRVRVRVKLNTWGDTAKVILSTCERLYGAG
ncbi:MAG: glycosyltransferase [Candidatus Freyarchaeota archaeon]|nr:glycosyltransferase [Candidatus Jordarchaeia archaeon]